MKMKNPLPVKKDRCGVFCSLSLSLSLSYLMGEGCELFCYFFFVCLDLLF